MANCAIKTWVNKTDENILNCIVILKLSSRLTRSKSSDMVFSATFCHKILAEEGVYIIYFRLYITVLCQMSALEARNPGHSEHTAFLSQIEKTSQNWFKQVRFNWPSPESFFLQQSRV